ncbi:MAG: M48 family metallopeptidase [Variibacter sp.]|nr:M48 family metallopeptidase [Variibacter sp.]
MPPTPARALRRPRAPRHGRRARLGACVLAAAVALAQAPTPAAAQAGRTGGLPVIRDAESEQLLREYTAPILKAARLAQQRIQVIILNERSFNAFVADGRHIFINAGALLDAKTPNETIGVLAHETGHIAGGHLSRLRQEIANLQTVAMIASLVSVGAVVAGAATGSGGLAQGGTAGFSAGGEIVRRSLLSYQRAQEEAADRAAVRFLTATGQSPKGMHDTFKRFAEQTLFISQRVDPYLQSHPMARERVESLAAIARTSPYWEKRDPPELQLRHDMMRAKISGFLDRPDTVARRYPLSDTSLPARYARAVAAYRHSDLRAAIGQIDGLIQTQPQNPYFQELKGQALLEAGRPREALEPLRRAVALAPDAHLIRIMLGQALVATNDRHLLDEAIATLQRALALEPDVPEGYRFLAMAFARKGDLGHADLASAQSAFSAGDIKTARELAGRARLRFPTGSPGWVKADDIYSYKPPRLSSARPN